MRYNKLTKFYKKQDNIIIDIFSKKIILPYSDNIYNMFVYFEENIYIKNDFFIEKNISSSLINLFLNLRILEDSKYNSGCESLYLDRILQNPSNLLKPIDDNGLNKIYSNIYKNFYASFDESWKIYKRKIIGKNIEICDNGNRYSIRKNSNKLYKKINLGDFLLLNKSFLGLDLDKGFQGMMYGSGGGFYSVSNLIIAKNDIIYLFDKYENNYFYKKIPGIFEEYVKNCLINFDNNISFDLYNYHVVLFSNFENVFQKYGNRGYRYIQIESGAIGSLFRNYLSSNNFPYLELQGFIEANIYNLLDKHKLLLTNKVMITHTICCG